jgi:cytochrome c oxidase cbb3-type subunit 4
MFDLSYEQLLELQGWAKIIFTTVVFVLFYSYIYSMYKRDKTGERDYESYSKLVLDDEISSEPLEDRNKEIKEKEGELK